MSFISPMLAGSPTVDKRLRDLERVRAACRFVLDKPGPWSCEQKFDGHRIVVRVSDRGKTVHAWSREGKVRALDRELHFQLAELPDGVYDGELIVPGHRCHAVTDLRFATQRVYVIFDVLELLGVSTALNTLVERRAYLDEIFSISRDISSSWTRIRQSKSFQVSAVEHIVSIVQAIWANDGEGIILKREKSRYAAGKRPAGDWYKLKALRSSVLTVIGFEASKGLIMDRGDFASVVLQDEDGVVIRVKTLNNAELQRFEDAHVEGQALESHPAIGRKLRIEYQERTPDGSYREPRWDRWEDE